MTQEIDVTTVPARTVAVYRFHVASGDLTAIGEKMGGAFGRVISALRAAGVVVVGPAIARYQRAEDGFDVAAGLPISEPITALEDGVASLELPSTEVAHTTHIGAYEDLPKSYDALRAAVESRGRHLDEKSPMWEEYLTGPETPPELTRTEVYWPLAE
jgi:effector-binding domain-containing protein